MLLLQPALAATSRSRHSIRSARLLSLVGAVALLFGIIEGPERGWTDGLVLAAFVVSVVVLAAFLRWELHSTHPMLPLDLFRDRRFSVGGAMVTLTFFPMVGFWFLSSQFLQFGRGYSPLLAGGRDPADGRDGDARVAAAAPPWRSATAADRRWSSGSA